MSDRLSVLLTAIAVGIWVIVLQNAGVVPPIPTLRAQAPIDVNLYSVVGRPLVESKTGMLIGVSGANNTLIPINWGEVTAR